MSAQPQLLDGRTRRDSDFIDRIAAALPDQILEDEMSHLRVIEGRLTRLPEEILRGIEPLVIARKINEVLQARIAETGIPETAKKLTLLAQQMNEATGEFQKSSRLLIDAQDRVADHSLHAIDRMQSGIEKSTSKAEQAAITLNQSFVFQYRWSVFALTAAALVLGFLLGMLTYVWTSTPSPRVQSAAAPAIVATQPDAPPAVSKKPTKKSAPAN